MKYSPHNSQLIFIDQQPQMAFGVQSIDRQVLKNNVVGLAKVFNIPTTITTVESDSFSGHTYPELLDVFPNQETLERTSMNSWDDQKVRDALAANGRKKVVVSGLWTEVCNTTFALCAMLEGDYEIYMVADASGGTSKDAHDFAMQRMVQAGVGNPIRSLMNVVATTTTARVQPRNVELQGSPHSPHARFAQFQPRRHSPIAAIRQAQAPVLLRLLERIGCYPATQPEIAACLTLQEPGLQAGK